MCGLFQRGQLGRLPHDLQHSLFLDDIKRNDGGIDDIPSDVNSLLQMKQKFLWNCSPGQVL